MSGIIFHISRNPLTFLLITTEIVPWIDSREIDAQSSDTMNVTAYLEHFYGSYNQKYDKQFYQDKSLTSGHGSSGSNVSGRKNDINSTGRGNRYVNYTEPKYYLGE